MPDCGDSTLPSAGRYTLDTDQRHMSGLATPQLCARMTHGRAPLEFLLPPFRWVPPSRHVSDTGVEIFKRGILIHLHHPRRPLIGNARAGNRHFRPLSGLHARAKSAIQNRLTIKK